MPYYQAGDYYQGDYYQAGGIFGSIGKALKKVAGTALSLTPVGRVAQAVIPQLAAGPSFPKVTGFQAPMVIPKPGFGGVIERFLPGGESGYMVPTRRRMNVTNVKALRRAGRRVRGFLKIARRLGALPVGTSSKGKLFKKKRARG